MVHETTATVTIIILHGYLLHTHHTDSIVQNVRKQALIKEVYWQKNKKPGEDMNV